jgi:hypothetical protein
MHRTKRYAAACLVGGLALAVATPAYVAYASPGLAGYLLHVELLLLQGVPYALCAVLWLPWRSPRTRTPAVALAIALLLATMAVHVPILWAPAARGGDMIALAYVAITASLTIGVLLGSAAAGLVIWRSARRPPAHEGRRAS